ncbi:MULTISPECIES: hypothetical protein [Chryseobacterium]|jgi:hypothetical protein|uniref:Redox-active disulfide protein 2 n=1 Tax=Chryseobacterium balustinum TaxID=246 RepID=A0AAX2IPS2_9FLAO|nr:MULTISPECIES: hypothetical protein [Chryseobacterium]AZB29557.1 hypothetical protein EB354_09990 [Chryseobacterium balustinum]MDY0932025.1 hypothetical protein [Chryseobacterium sp. CFBP8996]SKB72691.1 hypothetical protein SAMN05421800_10720 [Chryseobacterium balustinum]SQA92016.1 Uncharacterised protein [Chryseobacterium balustinum]
MKANKLSELSIEELESKKKTILSFTIGIGSVMIIACCILFYFAIKSKNFALIAVAFGCSMTLMPSFISIGQINSEIKSRKSKYL